MNREEAYYYKLLLINGIRADYDSWLNSYLETEGPLSDIVLNLAFCTSDTDKTVSYLHSYCFEAPFDEKIVCEKLRLFLKEAYNKNIYTMEDVCTLMYNLSMAHGDPSDFKLDSWYDMFYLPEYFELANDGVISQEKFEKAFLLYLNEGISVDYENLFDYVKKPSLFEKIKNWFRNK